MSKSKYFLAFILLIDRNDYKVKELEITVTSPFIGSLELPKFNAILIATVMMISQCGWTLPPSFETNPPIAVGFTPGDNCTDAIVKEVQKSKKTVLAQAYSFTSVPVAKALLEAQDRGVKVEIFLDKRQVEKYSLVDFLSHVGILTFLDKQHAILHNKVMVIDDSTVLTEPFNFTKATQENAENLIIKLDSRAENNKIHILCGLMPKSSLK